MRFAEMVSKSAFARISSMIAAYEARCSAGTEGEVLAGQLIVAGVTARTGAYSVALQAQV